MISHRTEKTFLTILQIGLFFVLATFVIFSSQYFFPYITPRAAYFQILVTILFAITLVFLAIAPQYRPRKSALLKAVAVYIGANILATIFSADPMKSFTGSFERSFGLLHLLHYGMLFIVLSVALRNLRQWHAFIATSVIISLLVGIGFFIGTFLWQGFPNSLTGNRSFLAGYLFINLFFAIYLCFETTKQWKKSLLGIISIFLFVVIALTGIRGVMVGFFVTFIYFVSYFAVKFPVWRKRIIGLVLILVGLYGLLFINRNEEVLQKNYFVQQITTNMNLQDSTVQARFSMWRSALRGFLERPLLGWGRENFSLVFNKYFDAGFDKAKVGEAWEDRAHNIFLDELTVGGLIGFAAFLYLLFCAFGAVKSKPIFVGLLIGYLGLNSFGVETANTAISFFLFLGLADFLQHEGASPEAQRNPKWHAFAFVILAIIILPSSLWVSIRIAAGNKALLRSLYAASTNNFLEFESKYREGKKLLGPFPYLRTEMLILASSNIKLRASFALPYEKIFAEDLKKLADRSPWELRSHVSLGILYTLLAVHSNEISYLNQTEEVFSKLLAVSPERKMFRDLYYQTVRVKDAILKASTSTAPAARNP